VQVKEFEDDRIFPKCSGYGLTRSREWFIQEYLADVAIEDYKIDVVHSESSGTNPWERECPYFNTKHALRFINPRNGKTISYTQGLPYLNMEWEFVGLNRRPVSDDLIARFPDLANGWTKQELQRMKKFLHAKEIIFDGKLRLLPAKAEDFRNETPVANTKANLAELEGHISGGRIPILKDETKERLMQLAREYEVRFHGRLLDEEPKPRREEQPGLFGP